MLVSGYEGDQVGDINFFFLDQQVESRRAAEVTVELQAVLLSWISLRHENSSAPKHSWLKLIYSGPDSARYFTLV